MAVRHWPCDLDGEGAVGLFADAHDADAGAGGRLQALDDGFVIGECNKIM